MSSITINLTDEHLKRLREIAARLGIPPEEPARVGIEELIAQPDEKFNSAADYVLKKNADLYRRLA
ncbi:MAG: DNA-binding protein [Pyrinomonadaceae bacterium]|nr:DNA-binding protein [Pyrinomonadaceae bacterium]